MYSVTLNTYNRDKDKPDKPGGDIILVLCTALNPTQALANIYSTRWNLDLFSSSAILYPI
jgi:hypothetical protein